MFQTDCRENKKTTFCVRRLCFSFRKYYVYEIKLKNIVQPGKPRLTVWCLLIVRWITKATNKYSEYAIHIACTLKHWLHERAKKLLYIYIAVLLFYDITFLSALLIFRSFSKLKTTNTQFA